MTEIETNIRLAWTLDRVHISLPLQDLLPEGFWKTSIVTNLQFEWNVTLCVVFFATDYKSTWKDENQ